jgi:DNA modification methylase
MRSRPIPRRGSLIQDLHGKSRTRREALARSHDAERVIAKRNDLLPKLELVERSLEDLRPPARNARNVDPAHVTEIAHSIAMLGFCAPVLIDPDGRVLDGWARIEAARRTGLMRVPCIIAGHLSAAERRVLRIAVNRLGEKGSWNLGELKLELQELIVDDAPIEIAGFSDIEIDQIMLDDEPELVEAGPLAPDVDAEKIARPGDLFALGLHRIACGDARDPALLGRLMGTNRARLVLTDVPYNVPIRGHVTSKTHREFAMASGEMSPDEFIAFNRAWLEAAAHHLVEGGVLGTFIDWRGYPSIHAAADSCALAPLNLVVWSKTNAGMGSLYRSGHELLPLFKKGGAPHINNVELGRHGRWRSNVWTYPGASSVGSDARQGLRSHPTVKPTALLEDALLDLTHRGEVVLDPFLGSGSTLIAAEGTGRICVGVELDPLYVDVVLRRFSAVTGRQAVRTDA